MKCKECGTVMNDCNQYLNGKILWCGVCDYSRPAHAGFVDPNADPAVDAAQEHDAAEAEAEAEDAADATLEPFNFDVAIAGATPEQLDQLLAIGDQVSAAEGMAAKTAELNEDAARWLRTVGA